MKVRLATQARTKETKLDNIAIVGCGAYMDSGYGCPGEWRCLKAAALGDGDMKGPSAVVAFVKCECPGRTVAPNMGMAVKLSEVKPDRIYLSSCFVNAKPGCPYASAEEVAGVLREKTGIDVVLGTHDYH